MDVLVLFLIIMAVAFLSPLLSRGVGLPEVTGIILFGILLGWNGLGVVEKSDVLISLAEFGLVFLMFLAGLEMPPSVVRRHGKEAVAIGIFTFIIPFVSGYFLAGYFGFDPLLRVLIAIILSTTSVGVVVPVLKELGALESRVGAAVLGAAILNDVASMIALAIVLKYLSGTPFDPVYFTIVLGLFFLSVLYVVPRLAEFSLSRTKFMGSVEAETRFLILVLLIVAIISEQIDLHPIIGAFIAGGALADTIRTGWFTEKLNALGYGFFVPIFLFVVGCNTNLFAVINVQGNLIFALALIGVGIVSKGVGALFSSAILGFSRSESLGIASAMITRLAVGLAAADIAFGLGKIDISVFTSFVLLAVLTTIITPPLTRKFLKKDAHVEGVVFGNSE
jgi:Kef-type K+ transport system membrane component KefB